MALTRFKVTNLTQGRLELRPYKIVLDQHEWVALAAPVAEEVNWLVGLRFVKIEPMEPTKVQPFTLAEPRRQPAERKVRREQDLT
jgi:hypothetical protein